MSGGRQASVPAGIPVPAFRALMRQYGTLLVHCAGAPKGAGNGTTANYGALECLKGALAGASSTCALAASTLREGYDEFTPFVRANCTGPLGVNSLASKRTINRGRRTSRFWQHSVYW